MRVLVVFAHGCVSNNVPEQLDECFLASVGSAPEAEHVHDQFAENIRMGCSVSRASDSTTHKIPGPQRSQSTRLGRVQL
jgi:hypothetical protein